jgi:ABC-type branched-subunit amino acid transport system ATPase component
LLVEQDLQLVARIARRVVVIEEGRLVREIAAGDLANASIAQDLLGI